jgi:hypothetical protein
MRQAGKDRLVGGLGRAVTDMLDAKRVNDAWIRDEARLG